MTKVMLGSVPLSRWQGLRDDLEGKIAGSHGETWANDLGLFLRKEPKWLKARHDFGDAVWTIGRARVDRPEDQRGRWVNGIYRDSKLVWFTNHMFFYTDTVFYDKKTFEVFEWHETTFPAWDSATLKGFCDALCSTEFGRFLSLDRCHHIWFTASGRATEEKSDARFHFSAPYGPSEIKLDLPEIDNGVILQGKLYESARTTLMRSDAQFRLKKLIEG